MIQSNIHFYGTALQQPLCFPVPQPTKVGAPSPGPPTGPRNFSAILDHETLTHASKTGEALKQSEIGPFAPISTQEAEVVFDVLDKRPGGMSP